MTVPPMIIPSAASTAAFVVIVAAVVGMLVLATARAGRALGEPPAQVRRWTIGTAAGALAWLATTGLVSWSGVLEADTLPPRALFFFAGSLAVALAFALTRPGARLAAGVPIAALVGFQAFRLPLELVLHSWYRQGTLPIQMTYEACNLDIVTGIAAALAGLWLWRRGPSRPLVWAFNLLGTALLVNVATIAVLSSPVPFRHFTRDPAVLLAFHFPYGWIVPFCVGAALAGHVIVFRWLARRSA
ncbi:hypothetical protein SAMN02745121_04557 [Nannocystis exedens]|uniref:Uncharacterized protein n=1 Tax=Nannocystis exedens TaxID=54 RepID=A0A1I2BCW0_9BACT|nr:hypothetical protein [Nannocystis exedens]PCC68098.1 hypothetical protein NAEX_01107 [Nannocystis exedens]SFE52990.1 hypothetical protein SAMN02745121_04557 [Nannocystis exedens]